MQLIVGGLRNKTPATEVTRTGFAIPHPRMRPGMRLTHLPRIALSPQTDPAPPDTAVEEFRAEIRFKNFLGTLGRFLGRNDVPTAVGDMATATCCGRSSTVALGLSGFGETICNSVCTGFGLFDVTGVGVGVGAGVAAGFGGGAGTTVATGVGSGVCSGPRVVVMGRGAGSAEMATATRLGLPVAIPSLNTGRNSGRSEDDGAFADAMAGKTATRHMHRPRQVILSLHFVRHSPPQCPGQPQ